MTRDQEPQSAIKRPKSDPSRRWVRHVAGAVFGGVQRCVMCGYHIIDESGGNVLYCGNSRLEPRGFEEGPVYVSNGNPVMAQSVEPMEGEKIQSCHNMPTEEVYPFKCRLSPRGIEQRIRQPRSSQTGIVLGEKRGGKVYRVVWDGTVSAYYYNKVFIEKIPDAESDIDREDKAERAETS